jgi:NAD(P)-dependent dehydrogenase (short-subunit alcohol dehydrogenase family)
MVQDKLALITGAGQGIGRAIALELAAQGAAGVAVADRDAATAAETAELVRRAGGHAVSIVCDLRDGDQIAAMVAAAVDAFGGLDVLVNNAGIIETALTAETTVDTLPEDVWDAVYEVNLKAPWLAIKHAAPNLRRSRRGPSIVNAASVSGLIGFPSAPIYCASKGGVVQLTRAAAADLAPTVRCNCFCPAVIETPMARAFIDGSDDPAGRERDMTAQQMIRRLGKAEEVAKLACFLASDAAAFITGAVYPVDGGALAWSGAHT